MTFLTTRHLWQTFLAAVAVLVTKTTFHDDLPISFYLFWKLCVQVTETHLKPVVIIFSNPFWVPYIWLCIPAFFPSIADWKVCNHWCYVLKKNRGYTSAGCRRWPQILCPQKKILMINFKNFVFIKNVLCCLYTDLICSDYSEFLPYINVVHIMSCLQCFFDFFTEHILFVIWFDLFQHSCSFSATSEASGREGGREGRAGEMKGER